jgi:uncharacterized protein
MSKVLIELSVEDCRARLAAHHVGRVAFLDNVGVMPMILPVNYVFHDDAVVLRTGQGSKLRAALHEAPAAFEIDGIDAEQQVGWSVVVRGHVRAVTDPDRLRDLAATPLVTWAPGDRSDYLEILASMISGRRISVADLPSTWWG